MTMDLSELSHLWSHATISSRVLKLLCVTHFGSCVKEKGHDLGHHRFARLLWRAKASRR